MQTASGRNTRGKKNEKPGSRTPEREGNSDFWVGEKGEGGEKSLAAYAKGPCPPDHVNRRKKKGRPTPENKG